MNTKDEPIVGDLPSNLRRRLRDIILDWPEPPIRFPNLVHLPPTDQIPWPLLVAPWRGGLPAMWDPATEMLHWKNRPPVWPSYMPVADFILMGETFAPDMRAPEYVVKYLLNNTAGTDFPLQATLFQINDTGEIDKNATIRAGHVVNLAYEDEPQEVHIPTIYQANSLESLNQYLDSFHAQGIIGAICRTLDSGPSDDQFIALDSL